MSTIAELGEKSTTAIYTLQHRAMATLDPKWNIYFQDKWALQITGGKTDVVDKYDSNRKTYPSIVLRSILIDRFLEKFTRELNIDQIVLYAAGYDTRSDRLRLKTSKGKDVMYFEVDLKSTQDEKLKILKEISYPTDNVKYVPFNLATGSPFTSLVKNGFNTKKAAIFVVEGLSMYLTEDQMKNILSTIYNSMQSDVIVMFDYFIYQVKSIHPNEPFIWYSKNPMDIIKPIGYWGWLYGLNFMYKDMFGSLLSTASSVAIAYGFFRKMDKDYFDKIKAMPDIKPIYSPVQNIEEEKEVSSQTTTSPLKVSPVKYEISYVEKETSLTKVELKNPLKVCIVQYNPHDTDKGLNMKKIDSILENRLGSQKCDFIVLPELGLTKYFFESMEDAYMNSDDITDPKNPTIQWMSYISKKYNSYVFLGLIEREDSKLYNTMVITNRDGVFDLKNKYRKCKLFDVDKIWATPGDKFGHIHIPEYGNVGIGICMDISTEDWSQKDDISTMDFATYMDDNNINIVVFISAVLFSKPKYKYPYYQQLYWHSRLRPMYDKSPYFIGVNRVNDIYCGSSCIMKVSENPNILVSMEYDEEDVKVYSL